MSIAAIGSLVALLLIVLYSCVRDCNVGILGVAAAVVVGEFMAGMKIKAIWAGWPIGLFMILVGTTFMFSALAVNGTLDKITANCIRAAKGNVILIPFIFFLITAFVTAIGPGHVSTVALMAPIAMAVAEKIDMSPFCMSLLIIGAAGGMAFSPFAPSGLISAGIIANFAPQVGFTPDMLPGINMQVAIKCFVAQTICNIGGFLIFGGAAWMARASKSGSFDIDKIAPKPEPLTPKQWYGVFTILCLVVGVLVFKQNVGAVSFMIGATYILFNIADDKASVKGMPWGTLIMVCGMSVLINVMDKSGGLGVLVDGLAAVSNANTVGILTTILAGVISAYASSMGVVMPMFLPLVPGLLNAVGDNTVHGAIALISSIDVGSHLVDSSPLSTQGALCIAQAKVNDVDRAKMFRNLLIWGLAMAPVGALVCWFLFYFIGW
jgi:di/tricarboxylate transporter